jgi:hypothetical protein
MNREYFKPKNQPVLDKYGRILVNEKQIKRRDYPLSEQEAFFPQVEPMFDAAKLREAYDYFVSKRGDLCQAKEIFNYLYCLEKDVSLGNQRKQP